MDSRKDLNREREISVQTAYLFDVDGVITDPEKKEITEAEIINFIDEYLERGNIVAFNTGRSTNWVIENVFPHMRKLSKGKNHFENFFIVGEKGGSWAEYKDGKWEHFRDEKLCVPEEIKKLLLETAEKSPYGEIGGDLDPKESMFSWEMHKGIEIKDFQEKRKPLVEKYKDLLHEKGLDEKFRVDPTTIAIDVEHKSSGKHLGAKRIIDWIKSKNLKPNHYITAGDSPSDADMADEIYSQGLSVEFWYVNPSNPLKNEKKYPVIVSKNIYTKGTLEIMKKAERPFSKK